MVNNKERRIIKKIKRYEDVENIKQLQESANSDWDENIKSRSALKFGPCPKGFVFHPKYGCKNINSKSKSKSVSYILSDSNKKKKKKKKRNSVSTSQEIVFQSKSEKSRDNLVTGKRNRKKTIIYNVAEWDGSKEPEYDSKGRLITSEYSRSRSSDYSRSRSRSLKKKSLKTQFEKDLARAIKGRGGILKDKLDAGQLNMRGLKIRAKKKSKQKRKSKICRYGKSVTTKRCFKSKCKNTQIRRDFYRQYCFTPNKTKTYKPRKFKK